MSSVSTNFGYFTGALLRNDIRIFSKSSSFRYGDWHITYNPSARNCIRHPLSFLSIGHRQRSTKLSTPSIESQVSLMASQKRSFRCNNVFRINHPRSFQWNCIYRGESAMAFRSAFPIHDVLLSVFRSFFRFFYFIVFFPNRRRCVLLQILTSSASVSFCSVGWILLSNAVFLPYLEGIVTLG